MASRKNVPAATVRSWAATPEGTAALTEAGAKFPGSRGRLDPTTLAVFHKANPRLRYETASEAEKPTITVPVVGLDKAELQVVKLMKSADGSPAETEFVRDE